MQSSDFEQGIASSASGAGSAAASANGLVRSRLWTPGRGPSGLIVAAQRQPLALVIGGRIYETSQGAAESSGSHRIRGRVRPVTPGGLVIIGSARQKEPTRVIGHPDLASGATVLRGETLYVSVAEAIYRESRGEDVDIHLTPTEEDGKALSDLRSRARHRWESDRLPDGWTRPLPPAPVQQQPSPKDVPGGISDIPEELRALAERIRAKEGSLEDQAERR
ncbi:MAG: hypothetical protein H7Z41_04610 [Cytophagales bacterium]|nr:hypothetical protein [Armatimonadota bacterium]